MLGFYVVNKPTGTNSTKMVSLVKRTFKQKCGHLGTLDPMASGVLPIAVGKATKLFDWFLKKDKKYFAIGLFGVETSTLDAEGEVISKNSVDIKKEQIDKVIDAFKGKIEQVPPLYSSISIKGKRAYDLARTGTEFVLPTRSVEIYDLKCAREIDKNLFAFEIHCSSGTYVRSLIYDIAQKLNTVATTVCIIRTASGNFNLNMAYTPAQIENNQARLIKVDEAVDLPKISVSQNLGNRLLNGQVVKCGYENGNYLCYMNNKLLGIVKVDNLDMKIDINLWEDTND